MDHLWTPWRYAYITQSDSNSGGAPAPASRKGVPPELAAWPGDLHCVFCNMLAAVDYALQHGTATDDAERAALILHRGDTCFLCLNRFPYSSGHILILPFQHGPSLAALPPATASEMMHLAQRTETLLRATYTPDGINLGINMGEAAGAGVAGHLHMHILPRWSGDSNFMTVTAETRILPELLEQTWQRLHNKLQAP